MGAEQLRLGLNVLHNLLLEVVFLEFLIYDRLFFFQQFQFFVQIVQLFFEPLDFFQLLLGPLFQSLIVLGFLVLKLYDFAVDVVVAHLQGLLFISQQSQVLFQDAYLKHYTFLSEFLLRSCSFSWFFSFRLSKVVCRAVTLESLFSVSYWSCAFKSLIFWLPSFQRYFRSEASGRTPSSSKTTVPGPCSPPPVR